MTAIGVVLRSCGTDVGPKAKCCNQCAPPDYGIRHAGRCAGHRKGSLTGECGSWVHRRTGAESRARRQS